jgi:hypothetical protein
MEGPAPSRRREFLRSPHHAVLALATLGLGFMTGQPFPLLAGAGLYALGWLYLPDMGFFRRWVDRRRETVRRAAAEAELRAFQERRDRIVSGLSPANRRRYEEVGKVCADIESADRDGDGGADAGADARGGEDPRLRKLDELAWTFLRLLAFQQSLEEFLESERREDLPVDLEHAASEADLLDREIADLQKAKKEVPEARTRLRDSARDRVLVLRKRIERVDQARENLRLVSSEQERLVQQLKLIRADAVASRNAQRFSTRIDATVEHLGETNRWLAQMEDFKDLVGDMPTSELRVGFRAGAAAATAGRAAPEREKEREGPR